LKIARLRAITLEFSGWVAALPGDKQGKRPAGRGEEGMGAAGGRWREGVERRKDGG